MTGLVLALVLANVTVGVGVGWWARGQADAERIADAEHDRDSARGRLDQQRERRLAGLGSTVWVIKRSGVGEGPSREGGCQEAPGLAPRRSDALVAPAGPVHTSPTPIDWLPPEPAWLAEDWHWDQFGGIPEWVAPPPYDDPTLILVGAGK